MIVPGELNVAPNNTSSFPAALVVLLIILSVLKIPEGVAFTLEIELLRFLPTNRKVFSVPSIVSVFFEVVVRLILLMRFKV